MSPASESTPVSESRRLAQAIFLPSYAPPPSTTAFVTLGLRGGVLAHRAPATRPANSFQLLLICTRREVRSGYWFTMRWILALDRDDLFLLAAIVGCIAIALCVAYV